MAEVFYQDKLDYIRQVFAPETEALKELRLQTTHVNDQISIYPEEGKLLQVLIRLGKIKRIVEIGCLSGYSALWMAAALPPDGEIITIEKDAVRATRAKANLTDPRIKLMTGDALQVLQSLSAQAPFDMVFIDADKLNYNNYLEWAEKNIRQGGLIVGDNSLLFDAVWMAETPLRVRQTALTAMREFNRRLADPDKYTGILLPTAEGMTIAVKNF
jgi:predicted O-methyltransferase YrrM